MIDSTVKKLDGGLARFNSSQMERDYLFARSELGRLGYIIDISDAGRTEKEDKETKEKYGFTGGTSHLEGKGLDIKVNGITAFKPGKGTHEPTEQGLKAAKAIQSVMGKYGFKWAGEKDIVHFTYTGDSTGQVVGVDGLPKPKKANQTISDSFFDSFGVLANNLTGINALPDKKIEEMSKFLIKAGKQT